MSTTMIQIRNVPDALHRGLKSRAALAGLSLSEFLLREIREVAERPTFEEMCARIAARTAPEHPFDAVAAVRAERDGR